MQNNLFGHGLRSPFEHQPAPQHIPTDSPRVNQRTHKSFRRQQMTEYSIIGSRPTKRWFEDTENRVSRCFPRSSMVACTDQTDFRYFFNHDSHAVREVQLKLSFFSFLPSPKLRQRTLVCRAELDGSIPSYRTHLIKVIIFPDRSYSGLDIQNTFTKVQAFAP